MEEITIDEIKKRTEALFLQWLSTTKSKTMDTDLPYHMLGLIFYIAGILHYGLLFWHELKLKNIILNKSKIQNLIRLGKGIISKQDCKKDLESVGSTIDKAKTKGIILASESISESLFDILKKYYPNVTDNEKELIKLIIKAESKLQSSLNQASQQE